MAGQHHSCVELYGRPGGRPVVYLHGVPGAALEARLIEAAAHAQDIELWAIDRRRVASGLDGDAYLSALSELVLGLGGHRRIPLLGFSIGAAFALRIASRLGGDAGPLLLMSAAGPLDVPDAFDGMGGGARVFRLARKNGAAFDRLVSFQALLARRAPNLLRRLLFAGADASDRRFAEALQGDLLSDVFGEALANRGAGYRRDLLTYVSDWSRELARVTARVEIWHGGADLWAPVGMAHAIAERLVVRPRLHLGTEGHYTTLVTHAPAALAAAREPS